eukprot:4736762-Amphidinium_carterae.1
MPGVSSDVQTEQFMGNALARKVQTTPTETSKEPDVALASILGSLLWWSLRTRPEHHGLYLVSPPSLHRAG